MGLSVLMPFAEEVETGNIVSIRQVERGAACRCVCLSCKTPVSARQGDTNQWHFGHRTDETSIESECDYSPVTAMALILRQQLSLLTSIQVDLDVIDGLVWSVDERAFGETIDLLGRQEDGEYTIAIEIPFANNIGFCLDTVSRNVDCLLSINTRQMTNALYGLEPNRENYTPEGVFQLLIENWDEWVRVVEPPKDDITEIAPQVDLAATETIQTESTCRCCGTQPGTMGKGLLCNRCVFLMWASGLSI
ncbi:hypothetical protein [Vibrio sp. 1180_3]|uniref:hypothetical protein n=1 Tax=Vibrio sp. 1180_3 TaxID=2528832 RepID=UPI002406A6EB|nr:hypothetical protein [Vibrio sp. 1180_3]MDF9399101.1 hypothetical protein [Vibrio sp. 1180_3]